MKTAKLSGPKSFLWTVKEYDQLGGILRDRRIELIEGRIIEMPPQKERHVLGVTLASRAAIRAFGERDYYVRTQAPLRQGRRSKPEPDVAVVAGNMRAFALKATPVDALLIIEVSDTTIRYDRGRKASLYAKYGVKDYWIVNLRDHQLEIHRNPIADPTHKWGFRFDSIQIVKPGDTIAPLAAPQSTIAVDDLLP